MNGQSLTHLIWILPLALLALYVGSPRFLGTIGVARVRRILDATLEKSRYTVMHDLTLPAGGGTVHLDHVVVSRFGIYVVDTVHRGGWISGTEVQARWRQKAWGRSRSFENPIHANFLRIQALERLLRLPLSRFHPLVVFCGHRGFKTVAPRNVVGPHQLIARIRAESRALLSPEEADRVVLDLQNAKLKPAFLGPVRRWKLLRLFLLLLTCFAVLLVYGKPLRALLHEMQRQANISMAPEKYHPGGTPKTDNELWEDRLICAYSSDSGRCACYDPQGQKALIEPQRCRELAQRGSILRQ